MSKKDEESRPQGALNPEPQRTSERPEGKVPDNVITRQARAGLNARSAGSESESEREITNYTAKALVGALMAQGLTRQEAEQRALEMVPEEQESEAEDKAKLASKARNESGT